MNKDFRLKTNEGNFINVNVFGLENIKSSPCLIFVHGFKGFKDWGFFPYTASHFAESGYFVITFNFSHNGVDEDGFNFNRLEKFAKNTISLEVSELIQVICAYKNGFFGSDIYGKIGLLGHSRGGAVSLLSGLIQVVDAYIIWASVAKLDRYTNRQKKEWKKQGFIEVLNSRTNQLMRMNVSLLQDIEANKLGSLSIENAVKKLNSPLLIIHGEQDLTVPIEEGEQLFNWSNKIFTQFEKIPACGHTFDIVHPFESSNKKFDLVITKTEEFLGKVFKV